MIARFSIRAEREESLDVVTIEPFGSIVAYAIATFMANSGDKSMLARPETPMPPKIDLAPRVSQMIELVIVASGSTNLCG
jgi:hypothetical protein